MEPPYPPPAHLDLPLVCVLGYHYIVFYLPYILFRLYLHITMPLCAEPSGYIILEAGMVLFHLCMFWQIFVRGNLTIQKYPQSHQFIAFFFDSMFIYKGGSLVVGGSDIHRK